MNIVLFDGQISWEDKNFYMLKTEINFKNSFYLPIASIYSNF